MAITAVSLSIAVPVALADEVDDSADDVAVEETSSEAADEATSESTDEPVVEESASTDDAVSEQQGGTDKCVEAEECSKQPPEEPEPTPEPEDPEIPDVEEPPVVKSVDDPPVEAGGAAPLPFTGPEDYFIPVAIGLLGLIGGYLLWTWAGMSDALRRFRGELDDEAADERTASAYGDALHQLEDERAA